LFSVKDLTPLVSFLGESKLYENLNKIAEWFLEVQFVDQDYSTKPVKKYRLKEVGVVAIPEWENIEKCRKKGIEGEEENKEIKENEGDSPSIAILEKDKPNDSNSLNSPSSPNFRHINMRVSEEKISLLLETIQGGLNTLDALLPTISAKCKHGLTSQEFDELLQKALDLELIEHFKGGVQVSYKGESWLESQKQGVKA
jgi:hypothetical protein